MRDDLGPAAIPALEHVVFYASQPDVYFSKERFPVGEDADRPPKRERQRRVAEGPLRMIAMPNAERRIICRVLPNYAKQWTVDRGS